LTSAVQRLADRHDQDAVHDEDRGAEEGGPPELPRHLLRANPQPRDRGGQEESKQPRPEPPDHGRNDDRGEERYVDEPGPERLQCAQADRGGREDREDGYTVSRKERAAIGLGQHAHTITKFRLEWEPGAGDRRTPARTTAPSPAGSSGSRCTRCRSRPRSSRRTARGPAAPERPR